ncbi:MAG: nicotinate-nucleotide--dimethylbenzimidazole phosphoribosyltransferase, partial [Desulfitobacteriaceae bacterium]
MQTLTQLEQELESLLNKITGLDEEAMAQTQARLDSLTKPQGSLGQLEEIAKQLAGMQQTPRP